MVDLSTYAFGKIPPQARDLEEAVIGACLIEPCIQKVLTLITHESFYVAANQIIFQALTNLYNSGKTIDLLTATEELKRMGKLDEVGGAYYLSGLTSNIASAAHIEEHALILAQKFIQREIIRISSESLQTAYEDDTDTLALLDGIISKFIKVTSNITKNSFKHISEAVRENMERIEKMANDPGKLLGYSTGLKDLDRSLHGIQPGVIVIAARPSMGKSALMGQLITTIAKQGVSCQVFTMEVNRFKYEMRTKTQLTGINFERIQTGNIYQDEWEKLSNINAEISNLPIWIDDSATLSMVQLRSKCLQAYENGVRCFALDFIQLTDGGNDNEKLSEMSRAVKIISQELNVPFIELSQLSREVEKRTDKKPMLSDLRNSGSLEQDADVVMLLYRPEYYGLQAQDKEGNAVDNNGFAQIRIAKNKDGKVGTIDLKFIGENLIFKDYEKQLTPFG